MAFDIADGSVLISCNHISPQRTEEQKSVAVQLAVFSTKRLEQVVYAPSFVCKTSLHMTLYRESTDLHFDPLGYSKCFRDLSDCYVFARLVSLVT